MRISTAKKSHPRVEETGRKGGYDKYIKKTGGQYDEQ